MNYKTQKVSYDAIHKWLYRYFGKAVKCENPNCRSENSRRFEWSLLKDKRYKQKRENFWQLCSSCHSIYDGRIDRLTKMKLKPVVAKKRDGTVIGFNSIKEAVKVLGVSKTAISNNLNGRSASAGGLKWSYVFV